MNEQLINGIYSNMINTVLEGVDEPSKQQLSVAYKQYLFDNYADTLEPDDILSQVIEIYTRMEKKKWEKVPAEEKQRRIMIDTNFRKLVEISEIGFKHAQRKLGFILSGQEYTPDITREQIISYIKQMKELASQVLPYNAREANMYLGEGILDFNYSGNLNENMSLRTGRIK